MAVRRNAVDEADRRARRQLHEVIRVLRDARLASGLRQVAVARALGVAHQLLSMWERGILVPNSIQLARWAAAVGKEVSLRVYEAGAPLRDAGHLQLLERAKLALGGPWTWHTEVPVTKDPLDRRAVDVVLALGGLRIGLELITRLTDVQAQVRQANLKLEASGLDRMLLVLGDTRHNRDAVRAAGSYLAASFPIASRTVRAALRAGQLPPGGGIIFV